MFFKATAKGECGEISQWLFEKLDSREKRLFNDNGTLSISTRIERHEQILHVLLWALSVGADQGIAPPRSVGLIHEVRRMHLCVGDVLADDLLPALSAP
jgi:hypothetical protein